jgi:hypothetical protein
MRFALKRVNFKGQDEWLNNRGEWSGDEGERILYDGPDECFRAGEKFSFYTIVEQVARQMPIIPSDFL